jgi:hypothetical protein
MTFDQAQAVVATKTAPKVTKESIEAKIAKVEFIMGGDLLTICIITMQNGFMVNGQSAPASPANYDKAVGEAYAYDNAFRLLWPLEGYLLKQKLYEAAEAAP